MGDNVLIVGAGPAGLCLSLALAARGMAVDLVERREAKALAAPEYDGREIALTRATMRALRDLGVWQRLPSGAAPTVRRARIMDGANAGFEVDGAAFGRDRLGVLVSNHRIRAAAWEAVADASGVRVHDGAAVEAVDTGADGACARLADGRRIEAALLVAADGRFSYTRRAMGIATHMHDFGMSMALCRMRHDAANDGTAWEWFGHGQTRALLPLGDHVSSTVLTVSDREARRLCAMPEDAFAEDMTGRFEGRLGAMTLESARHAYPLVGTWAHRFVGRRFALVGDAAVGMHPVTAHGFNLGVASVERLAHAAGEGLRRYRDPGHPAALARYQRRHRAGSAVMFAGTQTVATLFTDERLPARPLRGLAVGLGRRVPAMRRALAASLVDETPRPIPLARHAARVRDVLRPRFTRADSRR